MFCPNCGAQTVDGAAFCVKCGKQLPNVSASQTVPANPTATQNLFTQPPVAGGTVQINQQVVQPIPQANVILAQPPAQVVAPIQRVGFSNAVNDPRFASKKRTQGCASFIFSLIVIPMPLIGFAIYGYYFQDKMPMKEVLLTGAGVSGIFLLFYVVFWLKKLFSSDWEGVVTALTEEEHLYHRNNANRTYTSRNEYYYMYVVRIQTTSGKIKKIENRSQNSFYYNYFKVGDRVKYHHDIDYYEKYDKTYDTHILCPFCAKVNPITDDVCKCGAPIMK